MMVAVVFPKKKPPPHVPSGQAEAPAPQRVIERQTIIERAGPAGKDGRDGRHARPLDMHEYTLIFRRDSASAGRFVLESLQPTSEAAREYARGNTAGVKLDFEAKSLLRLTLGHDIVSQAIVGSRYRMVEKGHMVVASIVPDDFRPRVPGNVSTITLTLTVEVYSDES